MAEKDDFYTNANRLIMRTGDVRLPLRSVDRIFVNSVNPIEGIEFGNVDYVSYAVFMNDKYDDSLNITTGYRSIPFFSTNLPYEFYSKQSIEENIGNYDDNGNISFELHKFIIQYYFGEITTWGLLSPILVQMHHGEIIHSNVEGYIQMMIAKYLKLPTIPVTIYIADDVDETVSSSRDAVNTSAVAECNHLTGPYMFTLVKGINDDECSSLLDSGNYVTFQNPDDSVVDYYLHTNGTMRLDGVRNTSNIEYTTDMIISQSLEKLDRRISEDIERYLRSL